MYNQAQLYKKHKGANQYLLKEILEATPQQLLIKVYDYAIVHSKKNDLARTNMAIQELVNALRYDGGDDVKEFSIGMLRLYQFCQDQMRAGKNELVTGILTELRKSWLDTFEKSGK